MTRIEKLLRKAVELSARPDDTFLDLARALAAIYAQDKALLGRFIEQSGIGRRKAYYLLDLGKRLADLSIPDRRLQKIGWTKLQVVGKQLTRRNAEKLLGWAEECNAPQLAARIRGETPSKTRCVLLYFNPAQYRQFERAILTSGGKRSGRGLVGKEAAIMKMVRQINRAELQGASKTITKNSGHAGGVGRSEGRILRPRLRAS